MQFVWVGKPLLISSYISVRGPGKCLSLDGVLAL